MKLNVFKDFKNIKRDCRNSSQKVVFIESVYIEKFFKLTDLNMDYQAIGPAELKTLMADGHS